MSLERLGLSNYTLLLRRDIQALPGVEANHRFLKQFKTDATAMRDLRNVLAERSLGFPQSRLPDDEVLTGIATLLASGQLLAVRNWPLHGGSATQTASADPDAPETASKPLKSPKTWIEIELMDENGEPVPGEAYRIELPDGRMVQGRLDGEGKARFRNIDPGTCQVSFPEVDASEWKAA